VTVVSKIDENEVEILAATKRESDHILGFVVMKCPAFGDEIRDFAEAR